MSVITNLKLLAPIIKLTIPNIIQAFETYKQTNDRYDLVFCVIYTSNFVPRIDTNLKCIRCNLTKEYREKIRSLFLVEGKVKAGIVKLNPHFSITCYPEIHRNFLKNQGWQFSLTYSIKPSYSLMELENLILDLEN
jgi:hypothetical protein